MGFVSTKINVYFPHMDTEIVSASQGLYKKDFMRTVHLENCKSEACNFIN